MEGCTNMPDPLNPDYAEPLKFNAVPGEPSQAEQNKQHLTDEKIQDAVLSILPSLDDEAEPAAIQGGKALNGKNAQLIQEGGADDHQVKVADQQFHKVLDRKPLPPSLLNEAVQQGAVHKLNLLNQYPKADILAKFLEEVQKSKSISFCKFGQNDDIILLGYDHKQDVEICCLTTQGKQVVVFNEGADAKKAEKRKQKLQEYFGPDAHIIGLKPEAWAAFRGIIFQKFNELKQAEKKAPTSAKQKTDIVSSYKEQLKQIDIKYDREAFSTVLQLFKSRQLAQLHAAMLKRLERLQKRLDDAKKKREERKEKEAQKEEIELRTEVYWIQVKLELTQTEIKRRETQEKTEFTQFPPPQPETNSRLT
jgi:hypothetical protein